MEDRCATQAGTGQSPPHVGRTATQRFLFRRLVQPYWRLQRGLTLGAQGVVIDGEGRVLLVRHSYRPGWCFPGGGVERGETIETALSRELDEEAGIALEAPPELFALYSNERAFPGDHIALYVIRHWRRLRIPEPNREIVAHGFHPISPPPGDCDPATARRLAEIFGQTHKDQHW